MNRFIRFEYNDKELSSIDDYKRHPVLSLESALEPVLTVVENLSYYIEKAKKSCNQSSEHGLTEDESAAVYIYTDEWSDQSLNRILNQTLQSEERTLVTPWFGFLKLFHTALKKLPIVKKTLWRGLPKDIAMKLKENEELICWGVTSCSTSVDIINSLLNPNSVLCSIEPFNGKNVCGYTPYEVDNEVLLFPGTRLRVKSKESNNEEDKLGIHLEEISEVDDEQVVANDIEMLETHESANEEDKKDDDDYSKTTSTKAKKKKNEKSPPKNEEPSENETKAVITFSSGDRYHLVYRNNKMHGYGKYYSVNGGKIEGQEANDRANGEGICACKNDDRFIGIFSRGKRHGHGIIYHANGKIQAGNWVNDESTGQCLTIKSGSDQYEWRDETGEKRWYGAYHDDNGNIYIGNVLDGKAHGLGVRIWADKNRYEGNFKNDKKHGYGIYYYTDRDKYMGEWTNDHMNGQGKLKWTSGARYEGSFVKGKRHGQGTLTFSNQQKQKGEWENDNYLT